jgi:hypothetical protein
MFNQGKWVGLIAKTCALLIAKTCALLIAKTCALLIAKTCALLFTDYNETSINFLIKPACL